MLKYYYDLMSQPSRAIYVFLRKNKIDFQKCEIRLAKGEHQSAEYAAINPFKVVPAIDDNGFKLSESIAIFRYIMATRNLPEHWYPKNVQQQARVDQYLSWQHNNVRISCAMFFQHKFLIPLMTRSPPKEDSVKRFQARMEDSLDAVENIWLKDSPYIVGNKLSFADLLAFCELQQPGIVGYDIFEGHPKLEKWYKTVEAELQPEIGEASAAIPKVKALGESILSKL